MGDTLLYNMKGKGTMGEMRYYGDMTPSKNEQYTNVQT